MRCEETLLLIDAFVDDELDVPSAAQVQRHVELCAGCDAALRGRAVMRRRIAEEAERYRAPDELHRSVRRSLGLARVRRFPMFAVATAAAAIGGILVALVGVLASRNGSSDAAVTMLVDGHVRSLLLADHLIDVASSDRHTVHPWFDGKIDFAPPVIDLAAQGFALRGGRLDYVNGRAVAALVYYHGKHPINLFVWRERGAGEPSPGRASRDGFNLVQWQAGGMRFAAVSDLNPRDLDEFVSLLRAPPVESR
jgi:anti-sigma factor RsiW